MRIPSGLTTNYVYFVAVDATDLKTREPGLSAFTVYRSRNGAAAAVFTTPTINETDVTNMPGVYELLVDEDTTLDAGSDSQEMVLHITCSGMAPVDRVIEIYRAKITLGETLTVTSAVIPLITTVTTATNLTNAPTAGDLTATMKTSVTTAATAATPVAASVTGAVGSVTGAVGSVTGAVGSVTGAVGSVTGNVGGNVVGSTASVAGAVGSVTGNVGGNVVGTVGSVVGAVGSVTGAIGSVGAGGITASSYAAGAIDAAAASADFGAEIADAILNRNMATGTDSGSTTVRTVRQALRFLRNKWSIAAGTLDVLKEDDSTSSWTAVVTTAAGDPVDSVDPSGP